MADYKIYRLNGVGQIASVPVVVSASDDEGALVAARDQSNPYGCEIWRGNRLIARIDADGESSFR